MYTSYAHLLGLNFLNVSLTGPRRGSQKETEIYQREKPGKEKQKDTKTQT